MTGEATGVEFWSTCLFLEHIPSDPPLSPPSISSTPSPTPPITRSSSHSAANTAHYARIGTASTAILCRALLPDPIRVFLRTSLAICFSQGVGLQLIFHFILVLVVHRDHTLKLEVFRPGRFLFATPNRRTTTPQLAFTALICVAE